MSSSFFVPVLQVGWGVRYSAAAIVEIAAALCSYSLSFALQGAASPIHKPVGQ